MRLASTCHNVLRAQGVPPAVGGASGAAAAGAKAAARAGLPRGASLVEEAAASSGAGAEWTADVACSGPVQHGRCTFCVAASGQ